MITTSLASRRAILLILDGVGIGEAPDTAAYGDQGSNTLGNLAEQLQGLRVPNLASLGLGRIAPLAGVEAVSAPTGAWGSALPRSAGKDSTTGHWELAGVHLPRPFPTYPHGFPPEVLGPFVEATGRGVLANSVASGTAVIEQFAEQQKESGSWIVYTSADSVFQIAAHEEWIPLGELYRACEIARAQLVPPHDVSRVIARPFVGTPGLWTRTANRRDFSLPAPESTLVDELAAAGIPRYGIGKVDDLFAGRNLESQHTLHNADGVSRLTEWLDSSNHGFCFVNLVDFDQLYGHRNDGPGFADALTAFDAVLPRLLAALREDDLLIITADHGNDPTTPSTDHSRERVPVLVAGPRVRPVALGERDTFSDVGATLAEWFGLSWRGRGQSFLAECVRA
jgi:phosphopentomutase